MRRKTGRRIDCICVKMDRTNLEAHGEVSVDYALHQHPPLQPRMQQKLLACASPDLARRGSAYGTVFPMMLDFRRHLEVARNNGLSKRSLRGYPVRRAMSMIDQ